jgi:hypothetical protein
MYVYIVPCACDTIRQGAAFKWKSAMCYVCMYDYLLRNILKRILQKDSSALYFNFVKSIVLYILQLQLTTNYIMRVVD